MRLCSITAHLAHFADIYEATPPTEVVAALAENERRLDEHERSKTLTDPLALRL